VKLQRYFFTALQVRIRDVANIIGGAIELAVAGLR